MRSGKPRTVLVTGGSSGIGRAIVDRLAADGHHLISLARRVLTDGVDAAVTQISIDLADLDMLPPRLDALRQRFPAIDAVVCNAGAGRFGSLEEFSYAQLRALIDLDLTSQIFVARALLPSLKRRGTADLIFMGSEAALAGGRKGAVYAAAKAGLRGLAQALRAEGAPAGVRVTLINPGMVATPFFDALHFAPGTDPANHILPDDVADTIAWLLAMRAQTVVDEINLSPLKTVVKFRKNDSPC